MVSKRKITPIQLSILIGSATSIVFGFLYLVVLGKPLKAFYLFALLAFIVAPVSAGVLSSQRSSTHKTKAFFASGSAVFGIAFLLFFFIYAIQIRFHTVTVTLPAACDGTYTSVNRPADLAYTLPDGSRGISISEDANTVLVAKIDTIQPQHPSEVFLIRKGDGKILWNTDFQNDNVAVAMDQDTAYIFNVGIGYFIDKQTGKPIHTLMTMDSYGTNTLGYFETSGIISSWNADGSVKSLPYLLFSGVVRGCYISGDSQSVTKL